MKKTLFILLFFISYYPVLSQNLFLEIKGSSESETKIIDSTHTLPASFSNASEIIQHINSLSKKLSQKGFLQNEIIAQKKTNDSTFFFQYSLGKQTPYIYIFIDKSTLIHPVTGLKLVNDTLAIPIKEVESFMKTQLDQLEKKGFSMASIQLVNFKTDYNKLSADLLIKSGEKRTLNDIVVNGYDKFPNSHTKNILRLYKGKTFNQNQLQKIFRDFEKFGFVNQFKYPEILFTEDSTKVYVYLEKAKPSRFEGFIGFSNDDSDRIQFNGYLDLMLYNALNSGEKFVLYWKNDGNNQTTFNVSTEVPYLFKSPLGLKGELNVFKQDSTFQNTRTAIDLGYYFSYNKRVYLGYLNTSSNDIQNIGTANLDDYTNTFFTFTSEYSHLDNQFPLFPEKTRIQLKTGIGSRKTFQNSTDQLFAAIFANHNFYLNQKNILHLKTHNYLLQSENYLINELFRFGGINSIRGFNENSLQANFFTSILSEYRYVLAPSLYVHSIVDYGFFQDKTTNISENLLGLGFGLGIQTKNGLFNLIYANGSTKNQEIKLSNSIVHISFRTNF